MFYFAFQNLHGRKVRSVLAVLGMSVAIFAMVGLFSVGAGLEQVVTNTLNRVPGLVAMQRGAPIPLFSTLPASWADEIRELPGVRVVVTECWARANVIDGTVIVSPPRLLCGADIESRNKLNTTVYKQDITDGRFLTNEDIGTTNCVVSEDIAGQFDKGIGDVLEINGYEMKIVGIYKTGSLLLDVAILLDIGAFRRVARFDANSVSSMYIEQDGSVPDEELAESIRVLFRDRNVDPYRSSMLTDFAMGQNPLAAFFSSVDRAIKSTSEGKEKTLNKLKEYDAKAQPKKQQATDGTAKEGLVDDTPIEVRVAAEWAGRFESFSEDLDIFLFLMTSIGVVIAVVSVMNTMLMSVTERIVEFGILRANGWSEWNLTTLITLESGLLGLSGGVLGSILGWIAVQVVNATFPQKIELYAGPQLLIFSILFSTALGVLGGLYPAFWVSRLSPMDAIRRG